MALNALTCIFSHEIYLAKKIVTDFLGKKPLSLLRYVQYVFCLFVRFCILVVIYVGLGLEEKICRGMPSTDIPNRFRIENMGCSGLLRI